MKRALSNSDLARLSGVEVGVATSSFQCEGGLDQRASPQSNWSEWQRLGRVERIGAACDLWRRFPQVIQRLEAMGATVFRLSFEWSRLCPDGSEIDAVAAREYASRIASLSAAGIVPIVTLQHFTHPAWLGADFWLDRRAPEAFADYARRALSAVQSALRAMGAPPVTRVITINEPNMLALASWGAGVFPHGAPSLLSGSAAGVARALLALDHMLSAHVLAYDAAHAVQAHMALPRLDVSINVNLVDLYSLGAQWLDALRTGERSARDRQRFIDARRARFERCFLEPDGDESPRSRVARALEIALRGPLALEAFDRLSHELSRRGAAPAIDSRAFDLYDPWTRNQARGIEPHLDQLAAGALQWQRERATGARHQPSPRSIGPKALVADAFEALSRSTFALAEPWEWRVEPEMMVRSIDALFDPDDPIPIDVMENGMSVRRDPGSSTCPREDGASRPAFIREYTAAFAYTRCVLELPARTYAHWTLVDNYELGRWAPRFGLFALGDEDRGRAAEWSDNDASGEDSASALRAFADACRDPDAAQQWAKTL